MKLPPSKQAKWPDSRSRVVFSNCAKKVNSGRDDGWDARCAMELSAARTQRSLYDANREVS